MLTVEDQEQLPVSAARAGDADAWDALFARYQMPLYVYVQELVHDEQTSLDLVQEAFIGATRYLDRLREDGKFGSWLFSIAHQKVIQHWRRRRPSELLDEDALAETAGEGDPRDWLIEQEQEEEFLRLLNRFIRGASPVLLLHFLEDFSMDDREYHRRAKRHGEIANDYAKRALRKLMEETP
jgi:RNA polymerase sigma-70 factor (ECF subfamily)